MTGDQREAGRAELKLINLEIGEALKKAGFLPGLPWQLGPGADFDDLIDHPEHGGKACPDTCHEIGPASASGSYDFEFWKNVDPP